MTDKAKRKGNPRRRVFLKLLMMIVVLVAIVGASWYLLQPSPERIVYLAPDENGYFNIFAQPINTPNEIQQLTHWQGELDLQSLQVSSYSPFVVYRLYRDRDTITNEIWLLNTQTGKQEKITDCNCSTVTINHDASWIAIFESRTVEETTNSPFNHARFIVARNLKTGEERIIHQGTWSHFPQRSETQLTWLGETNQLFFWGILNDDIEANLFVYDLQTDLLNGLGTWTSYYHSPQISPDGEFVLQHQDDFDTR
ncbi:MAG: hypothetical protein AAF846_29755 [Chloroflexota bacterium]